MRIRVFSAILLVAAGVAAQTSQPSSSAKSRANAEAAIPKRCAAMGKLYKALENGQADISLSSLAAMQARSQSCLDDLLAQLAPDQRTAANAAFRLYQAAGSEIAAQVRQRDVAEERAKMERGWPDGAYRLASLFAQHAELSYRYDELLDEVQKYMQADEKFHQALASGAAPASTPPPMPITLPGKVKFLNCSDYHVGHISACWPPDDD